MFRPSSGLMYVVEKIAAAAVTVAGDIAVHTPVSVSVAVAVAVAVAGSHPSMAL